MLGIVLQRLDWGRNFVARPERRDYDDKDVWHVEKNAERWAGMKLKLIICSLTTSK